MRHFQLLAALIFCLSLTANAQAAYCVRLEDDMLFASELRSGRPVAGRSVCAELLREGDRRTLSMGVIVQNRETVFAILEDFCS